jgi:hypothetical protein
VSVGDVTQIAAEFKRAIGTGKDAPKTNGVDVLGWDFAFELNEVAKQQAAAANIQMRFGGEKLLIIHTDRSGEVSKKNLDIARKAAREVDDEKSPINCIVSVMMLREGWDVQGVSVIVVTSESGIRETSRAARPPGASWRADSSVSCLVAGLPL